MPDPKRSDALDHTAAVRPGEELDAAKLGGYLRQRLPEFDQPIAVEQFPRGHSNLTYLVRCGQHEMVLRRPPFGSKVKSAHDMSREYRVLSKLHAVYPAAPQALLFCGDESILGAPWYLMERIKGVILRKNPPPGLVIDPETARRLGESFLDKLVELHGLDYAAIGLGDLGRPEGYVARQVSGWTKRYYDSKTDELPDVERVAGWLARKIPSETRASLIHNDYKYDNAVLDPEDITKVRGVLDWEMCTVGDPLTDLGAALAYWLEPDDPDELQQVRWSPTTLPGTPTRAELVHRYAQKTGRDVSNIVFYYVFALFKTAVIIQQIYYRYRQGLTRDARFASMLDLTKLLLRAAVRASEQTHV